MEIVPKYDTKPFSLPLPIYETIHIADAEESEGDKFFITAGLDEGTVAQLKTLSLDMNDTALQKYATDFKRFGVGLYPDWYKKNRTPFALIHNDTKKLAALIWFGPKPLHEGCKCHSAGWRSYIPWRGKGLMKDFGIFVMDFYSKKIPNVKFWVAIKNENIGSVKFGESLGFKVNKEYSDDESIIMVK